MFKNGKYRYSLGFGGETEKERRVGTLLERLGNRKSSLIIDVLNEYIDNHPELENPHGKIEIKITNSPDHNKEKIEQMVRNLIAEALSKQQFDSNIQSTTNNINEDVLNKNIAIMLDNLDQF